MKIPYIYVSYCDENPPAGRWDQAWVQRILNAEEWRVPGGVEFFQYDTELGDPAGPMDGCVVIFPCGHYAEHCSVGAALQKLQKLIDSMPWSVVIATSDEGSTFPWHRFEKPESCRLWVMTPRPENQYPPGTFFIGEGCPSSPKWVRACASLPNWRKTEDVFFMGQVNHERREQMVEAIRNLRCDWTMDRTGGFTQGLPKNDYLRLMTQAIMVPAPSGPATQDSFRFYEALEAQAIPIPDAFRPGSTEGDYWPMLFGDDYGPPIEDWRADLPEWVARVKRAPYAPAATSAWWQQQKRRVAYRLDDDVKAITPVTVECADSDEITVLLVTSPSPLHPSIDITMDTILSVRERLPNAEILIGIDGLRLRDEYRATDYYEYARRLCAEVNWRRNICPFVFVDHAHQSGMVHRLLQEVRTEYVLFMEHDTPLCNEIDFDECVHMMDTHELGILRFTHEAGVLPEHAHLFLETQPAPGNKFVRTIQYSARPHLIRTDKLRDLVATYFGRKSKTFLEDTLYGALQYLPEREDQTAITGRARTLAIWRRHRMAVYAPGGTWKRSEHTDGRRGDPKLPTWIEYDGDRPEGGPPEGEFLV